MTTDDGQLSFDLLGAESDPLQQVWETFAPARLRQARVLASKKKTEVAAMVGVSAAAIGQYEAGVRGQNRITYSALPKH